MVFSKFTVLSCYGEQSKFQHQSIARVFCLLWHGVLFNGGSLKGVLFENL